jgi:hypothetical protein
MCVFNFLHFCLCAALLNDVFGIQTRAGCMCAGPYAQHLLGIDAQKVSKLGVIDFLFP